MSFLIDPIANAVNGVVKTVADVTGVTGSTNAIRTASNYVEKKTPKLMTDAGTIFNNVARTANNTAVGVIDVATVGGLLALALGFVYFDSDANFRNFTYQAVDKTGEHVVNAVDKTAKTAEDLLNPGKILGTAAKVVL